jgi:hypothetical protein
VSFHLDVAGDGKGGAGEALAFLHRVPLHKAAHDADALQKGESAIRDR